MGAVEVTYSKPQAQARGFHCARFKITARHSTIHARAGRHAYIPVRMAICMLLLVATWSEDVAAAPTLTFITETTLESTTPLDPRPIGGLSGLAHIDGNRWMAVSDDARSPRAYELEITTLESGELRTNVVAVHDIKSHARDAEAIVRAPDGGWFVGFESPATILHFDVNFERPRELTAARDAGAGLQRNKGWESITVLPGERPSLLAISELGPAPTPENPKSFWKSRAILLDPTTGELIASGDYRISRPPGLGPTGLVEIVALDANRFLALQRSLTVGRGYDGTIELVEMRIDGDTLSFKKMRLGSLQDLGAHDVGNVEAMAVGGTNHDGTQHVFVLSDDNRGRDGQHSTRIVALDVQRE